MMDGISHHCRGGSEQNHPQEKGMQEGKVAVKYLRKEEKQKVSEKGKDIPNWMQSYREQQGELRPS